MWTCGSRLAAARAVLPERSSFRTTSFLLARDGRSPVKSIRPGNQKPWKLLQMEDFLPHARNARCGLSKPLWTSQNKNNSLAHVLVQWLLAAAPSCLVSVSSTCNAAVAVSLCLLWPCSWWCGNVSKANELGWVYKFRVSISGSVPVPVAAAPSTCLPPGLTPSSIGPVLVWARPNKMGTRSSRSRSRRRASPTRSNYWNRAGRASTVASGCHESWLSICAPSSNIGPLVRSTPTFFRPAY
jgi:hypothetical protein